MILLFPKRHWSKNVHIFFYYDEGKSRLYYTGVQRKKEDNIL